ncbi:hypothetical protein AOLI_G00290600 [Acnodon oligacanthus]
MTERSAMNDWEEKAQTEEKKASRGDSVTFSNVAELPGVHFQSAAEKRGRRANADRMSWRRERARADLQPGLLGNLGQENEGSRFRKRTTSVAGGV